MLFLILVLVQGLHSLEEYIGKLWESFPPATILCGLVSENLLTGFLIINIGLFCIWSFMLGFSSSERIFLCKFINLVLDNT